MIDLVRALLDEERLLPRDAGVDFNILFARRYVIQIYRGSSLTFTAKLSPDGGLRSEHDILRTVHPSLAGRVPEPLAFRASTDSTLEIAVYEGIEHRAMPRRHAHAVAGPLADAVEALARAARERFARPRQDDGCGINEADAAGYGLSGWFSVCAPLLDALSPVAQHGDLALNNLGLAERGVVIFDWEDFGEVALPGYDLCILVCSTLNFDPASVERLVHRREPDWLMSIVARYCAAAALQVEDFLRLLPFYLLAFLKLKRRRGYGEGVARGTETLLSMFAGFPAR